MRALATALSAGLLTLLGCSGAPSTTPSPAVSRTAAPPVTAAAPPTASALRAAPTDCTRSDPFEKCKWACDQGALRSCVRVGDIYRQTDPKQAAIALEAACNGGEQSGCDRLAALYLGDSLEIDYPRAAALYGRACDGGYLPACGHLAQLRFRSEPGVEARTDEERTAAVKLLERACEAKDGDACGFLGAVHFVPIHGTKNQARGSELLAEGCSLDSEWSCKHATEMWRTADLTALGNIKEHERTARIEEFVKRQQKLRQAACEDTGLFCNVLEGVRASTARARLGELCRTRNHLASCNDLAFMLERGEQGDKDFAGAAPLFEIACKGGIGGACYELAALHKFGSGVAKDLRKSFSLMERSCALGFAQGCDVLGSMYLDAEGTERDVSRSIAVRRRACGWHDSNACRTLGVWLISHDGEEVREGEGVREGAERLREACNGDSRPSCLDYALLHDKGWGVPRDPKKARETAQLACDRGDREACGWLKNPALHTPKWVKEREQRLAKRKARSAATKEPR
ncbi:hypothetical protein sce0278 [Sorangium cellulosum So ce56]|uniref:Uncharacterized protein n=1 Tax=Sorangium cellulosum (strain So ce56) TaxID=448385 RepID=A9GQF9_SORC5|nr:hypothetical protein sce0278 [Sorangium cellulosum So ce56]